MSILDGTQSISMRKSTVLLSVLLSLTCLCLVALLAHKASDNLRNRVGLQVASEKAAVHDLSASLNSAASDGRPVPPAGPPKLTLDVDSPGRGGAGRIEAYESVLESQDADPVWTETMKSAVQVAYRGFPGVTVQSLKCSRDLCRLELHGSTNAFALEAKKGFAQVATGIGEQAFQMSAPDRAVIYVTREKTTLPPP